MGAGNAAGGAESRFVVLVGDFQALELFLEGVLPQAVMVEPQVHGLGLWGVQPRRHGGLGGGGTADVQLPRVGLPEVVDADAEAAARTAQ
ncbi:hypothetical protein D9M69_668510 [compost metagenome]